MTRVGQITAVCVMLVVGAVAVSNTTAAAVTGDRMVAGQVLRASQMIRSSNGYVAVMQSDGNFVVYSPSGTATWNTETWNHPGSFLAMQTDGNLVVYSPSGHPLWNSATYSSVSNVPAILVVQSDGNLVIYVTGVALWSNRYSTNMCYGSGCRVMSTYEAANRGTIVGRDCGYSQQVGSTNVAFWLFCDTPVIPAGGPLYFIPGTTAAIGSFYPGFAPQSLDDVPSGAPSQFLPTPRGLTLADGTACGSNGHSYPASWATGMTAEPGAPGTMLIAFTNYCVDPSAVEPFLFQGFGIAEYNTANGSLAYYQNVIAGTSFMHVLGSPVLDVATNSLYFYGANCTSTNGGCLDGITFMARVPLGSNPAGTKPWTNAANYQYWDGYGWTTRADATASILSGAQTGLSISVNRYPSFGNAFVMVSLSDLSGNYAIYTASTPTGPWVLHTRGQVAACAHQPVGTWCYANVGHPELSTSTNLAITMLEPAKQHVVLETVPW